MKTVNMTLRRAIVGLAVTAGLSLAAANVQAEVESRDPIKLTLHDWTGQLITTQIMGEVLKKAGYNIEYVQADYIAQFAGLKSGDLHVAMEIWETTGRDAMDEATATGKVENLGETGMVVPDLHEGKVPGIAELGSFERSVLRRSLCPRRNRP
mgnify:CR=1 FL=1